MGATHHEEIEETSDQLKKVTASRVGYVIVIGEEYNDVSIHIIDAKIIYQSLVHLTT